MPLMTARGLVDVKQAQLRNSAAAIGHQHRPDVEPALFCDPAVFLVRVEVAEEAAGDLCHLPLEPHVPAEFRAVKAPLTLNDPADVAWAMAP